MGGDKFPRINIWFWNDKGFILYLSSWMILLLHLLFHEKVFIQNCPKNDSLKDFEIYWRRFIQEYISTLYARKVTKLSCMILKKKAKHTSKSELFSTSFSKLSQEFYAGSDYNQGFSSCLGRNHLYNEFSMNAFVINT